MISWLVRAGGDLRQSPVHPSHFCRQKEGIWEVQGEALNHPGLQSTARTGTRGSQLCLCLFGLDAAAAAAAKSLQSCPTLCDPIDGSPPGSSVPGILQPRSLEWVAISFSSAGK